jgi:hypothetical protein
MDPNPTPAARGGFSFRLPRPIWIGAATAALVIVAAGWKFGMPIYRQQMAIREIERLGGRIVRRSRGPDWLRRSVGDQLMSRFDPVTSVSLTKSKATDFTLGQVAWLSDLERLTLACTDVGDAGLVHLQRMAHLQELNLISTQVTDSGMRQIRKLPDLQRLMLANTQVTDSGLIQLHEMTSLQYLALTRTYVTDAGLEHLKGLSALERLIVQETQVTDDGIADLKRELPRLDVLK